MSIRRSGRGVLPPSRLARFLLPIIFAIVTTAIGGLAVHFYSVQQDMSERALHSQLLTILDGKTRQITEWRRLRLGLARVHADSAIANRSTEALIHGSKEPGLARDLQNRLRSICTNLNYAGAVIVDREGRVVLWEGRKFGDLQHVRAVMQQVMASGNIVERDFDVSELSHAPHLAINIPLRRLNAHRTTVRASLQLYTIEYSWRVGVIPRFAPGKCHFSNPCAMRGRRH